MFFAFLNMVCALWYTGYGLLAMFGVVTPTLTTAVCACLCAGLGFFGMFLDRL